LATASRAVDDLLQNGGLAKTQQAAAEHAVDFDPPTLATLKYHVGPGQ
jgi:hypothetical protein